SKSLCVPCEFLPLWRDKSCALCGKKKLTTKDTKVTQSSQSGRIISNNQFSGVPVYKKKEAISRKNTFETASYNVFCLCSMFYQ
ncbi:MAG: hypothetical protein LBS01_05995, partial [Prevotellaceae bacterium]|nr:hypothetical protein [Prevotellaceae bacterium]